MTPVAFTRSFEQMFPGDVVAKYDWAETHSAAAVMAATNTQEFDELTFVLRNFELTMPKMARPGGNKSVIAQELDGAFRTLGWREALYEQRIETRLVNGDDSLLEAFDFLRVDVHAKNVVSGIRQARTGHEAHVAGPEYGYSHNNPE